MRWCLVQFLLWQWNNFKFQMENCRGSVKLYIKCVTSCIFTYRNSFKPVVTEFYGKSCSTSLKYDNCNCLQREDGDRRCEKQSGCHWGDLGVTKVNSYQANSFNTGANILVKCQTSLWDNYKLPHISLRGHNWNVFSFFRETRQCNKSTCDV